LEQSRTLEDLKDQVRHASAECRRLQGESRTLWQSMSSKTKGTDVNDKRRESCHLREQNTILKRVMADMIAGSQLYWYNDERLREIMLRLE